jgi:hypothetical protein
VPDRSEEPRFSTLRVSRPAEETERLIKFLKKVETMEPDYFLPGDSTLINERETLEQQLAPGHGRRKKGVNISATRVYKPHEIELSLFERRAPVTLGLSRLFSRARDWAIAPMHQSPKEPGNAKRLKVFNPMFEELNEAVERYEIDDPDNIGIVAVGIIKSPGSDADHRGEEYGLVMEPSALETQYLNTEAGIVYRAFKSLKNSNRVMYPETRSPLYLPFLRLPDDADPLVTRDFLAAITDDCLSVELTLGRRDWDGRDTV